MHQYTNNGNNTVILTVNDNDLNTANISKIILVGGIHITNLASKWNYLTVPFNISLDKTILLIRMDCGNYNWNDAILSSII